MWRVDVQQPVGRCFTALASSGLSQCVQYHSTSKFTAGFQHFPFIVFYRYGDIHWSWQTILFIIKHYPHAVYNQIYFLSSMFVLWHKNGYQSRRRGKNSAPFTWCDNIPEKYRCRRLYPFVVPEKKKYISLEEDWQALIEIWTLIPKMCCVWSCWISCLFFSWEGEKKNAT